MFEFPFSSALLLTTEVVRKLALSTRVGHDTFSDNDFRSAARSNTSFDREAALRRGSKVHRVSELKIVPGSPVRGGGRQTKNHV
jgi:hypothetical protein